MKRFTNLLNRTKSQDNTTAANSYNPAHAPPDSPEATVGRAIRDFCESDGSSPNDDAVLHLPVIVDAAESSPAAAAAAAHHLRKFISRDWSAKPYVQYNAVMLIRILSDNPGQTFTRNFDQPFVSTVKELLRTSKDARTQTLTRETLDALEVNKAYDEGLKGLLQMWAKMKGQQASLSYAHTRRQEPYARYPMPGPPGQNASYHPGSGAPGQMQQMGGRNQLPRPSELANRIEEGRNTAKILLQLIQSTPAEELMQHDLLKEFAERCQTAQKSMQDYINCDSPAPDDDTMQTLIETTEQLSLAGSRYQRAVLAARRATGASPSPHLEAMPAGNGAYASPPAVGGGRNLAPVSSPPSQYHEAYFPQPAANGYVTYQPPPGPPRRSVNNTSQRDGQALASQQPPPSRSAPPTSHDPFADPADHDTPPTTAPPGHPYEEPQHSAYAPSPAYPLDRRATADLENAYSYPTPISAPSKTFSLDGQADSHARAAPQDPAIREARPGPGAWDSSTVTPSYLGRQESALKGLTMHGAQSG